MTERRHSSAQQSPERFHAKPRDLPADDRRLWTITDLSEFLGVPIPTIYKWRAMGVGPAAFRVGKHLRWNRDEVYRWLETKRDEV